MLSTGAVEESVSNWYSSFDLLFGVSVCDRGVVDVDVDVHDGIGMVIRSVRTLLKAVGAVVVAGLDIGVDVAKADEVIAVLVAGVDAGLVT